MRKLLTDVKPFYCDGQLVTVMVRNVSTRFPHLLELNGSGTFSALGGGNGILAQCGCKIQYGCCALEYAARKLGQGICAGGQDCG